MFEVYKEFRYEAAHALTDSAYSDGRYSRLHGHSYRARVFVRGEPNEAGWVVDFAELEAKMGAVRKELDHRFLNEIADLGPPTLERMAVFIWNRLATDIPGLSKIVVNRDNC